MIRSLLLLLMLSLAALAPAAEGAVVEKPVGGFLKDDPSDRRSTIPHDPAMVAAIRESGLHAMAVRGDGWNETLESWARIRLDELTGRTSISGQDPAYTVLSMIYEPQRWTTARFLPVEHPVLLKRLDLDAKWVSPDQVINSKGREELTAWIGEAQQRRDDHKAQLAILNAVEQVRRLGPESPGVYELVARDGLDMARVKLLVEDKAERAKAESAFDWLGAEIKKEKALFDASVRLLERAQKSFMLAGRFTIVPDPDSTTGAWITGFEDSPMRIQTASTEAVAAPRVNLKSAARSFHDGMTAAFATASPDVVRETARSFLDVVTLSRHYPTEGYRALKNFYVEHNPYWTAVYFYALSTILFGLFAWRAVPGLKWAGVGVLAAGVLVHTSGGVIRFLLTGHMPVSNMYESITFTAWSMMAIALVWELIDRRGIVGLLASITGVLMLILVAQMPLYDARLHPLRAVLNSYWLNIHVTMMLVSYGAFALAAMFALGAVAFNAFGRITSSNFFNATEWEEFAYRLVQIGWPLLTVGILLGAIWADTAWGRFWGWDPKETWALITWIVYTIYLHMRLVVGWRGNWSATACLIGFVMVLITWLGVSYLPWFAGGLHTYASPQ